MPKSKVVGGKADQSGHLRRYIKEIDHGVESGQVVDRVTASMVAPSDSRPTINYILGGPCDDQYQSKSEQKKILRAAIVKARVNVVHTGSRHEETKPVDGPITFPLINPNRVILPHYDALVLTLFINGFDVHKVMIDPRSAADLLQLPAFVKPEKHSIFLKNGKMVNCCYSTGGKFGNFLDLG